MVEGEKDKISLYLRGYLGTDQFEEEKKRMIEMILSKNPEDQSPTLHKNMKETNLFALAN